MNPLARNIIIWTGIACIGFALFLYLHYFIGGDMEGIFGSMLIGYCLALMFRLYEILRLRRKYGVPSQIPRSLFTRSAIKTPAIQPTIVPSRAATQGWWLNQATIAARTIMAIAPTIKMRVKIIKSSLLPFCLVIYSPLRDSCLGVYRLVRRLSTKMQKNPIFCVIARSPSF
jgi:hypothetical protein